MKPMAWTLRGFAAQRLLAVHLRVGTGEDRALVECVGGDDGPSDMASAANMETVEPEVIADTVAWLVADTGKHITGVALPAGFAVAAQAAH